MRIDNSLVGLWGQLLKFMLEISIDTWRNFSLVVLIWTDAARLLTTFAFVLQNMKHWAIVTTFSDSFHRRIYAQASRKSILSHNMGRG